MSIVPVTYQGIFNFHSHLYALEIKSRFIDQNNANGYYTGYGSELEGKIVGNQIQIGTGAFVVQSRMNEITATEIVSPPMSNGFVGYVVARIETYHPSDARNCTLETYIATSLDKITLQQEDVYAAIADEENRVYELPIFSFAIANGAITNLTKLIKPVADYATVKAQIDLLEKTMKDKLAEISTAKDAAVKSAADAARSAADAATSAKDAETAANAATTKAQAAVNTAADAVNTADAAQTAANGAVGKVAELEQQIGERQGTTLTKDGVALVKMAADGLLDISDEFVISGGNA